MINLIQNRRGSAPITTAIAVLVLALLISVLMYFAYVEIQTMVIRNAMKTGLANLAVTISADTYAALRESDFEEYAAKLTSGSAHKTKLENAFRSNVHGAIKLSNSEYDITAISLSFQRDGKKIRYICTCDVTFQVKLLGINLPATAKSVQVEGSHTAKYGR